MARQFTNMFRDFAIIGLIVVGIFTFALQLQVNNNAPNPFTENKLLNNTYENLNNSLNTYSSKAQAQRQSFENENPTVTFGSLILFSIVSSGKVFTEMTVGIFNILIQVPSVYFGVNPIVTSVISAILIMAIIFGLWSVYKLGTG